jgi:RNA polymerase sigma factor (sigma-70 family)
MRPVLVTDETTDPRTDADLLMTSDSGDRESFSILFDRHSRPVYATAFAIVHNRSDAEELLSDAFLLLWRKREGIQFFGDSILPWLITTVRYLAKNRSRSSRLFTVALDDGVDAGRSTSTESAVELRALSRQLEALIGTLSPLDQRIVQLCLIDGVTYEEAAERLSITHGSVRNRLSRTKKQLRAGLDPEGQHR